MEFLNQIKSILSYSIYKSSNINITIGLVSALIVAFVLTNLILKLIRLVVTRNLPAEDKNKFISIFQFIQYLVYIFVIMFTLNATGVNISVFLTASAALFIGLGFALQQLFQDLISGVLIIIDQSLHVGDVIEINGKVCKVEKISLRSTKAVTRNQRVMVIPNHMFLTEVLFNWTQNSTIVREDLTIGVAYGSDTKLVKEILLKVATRHDYILNTPSPKVEFSDFGDSALIFVLYIFVADAFSAPSIKSELRFDIDDEFRKHKISIPFPQRDVHIFNPKD